MDPTPPIPFDSAIDGGTPDAAREAQLALLRAVEARRPVTRAVVFAGISAWTLAVFAVLSIPGAFSSLIGLGLVAGLGAAAFFEFRGRTQLKRMEPAGATALARNQLFIAGVVAAYCVASGAASWLGAGRYDAVLASNPELEGILGGMGETLRLLMVVFYAVVGVVAVGGQLLAWRFHTRRRGMVEAYLNETPRWILEHGSGPVAGVGRAA